MNILLTNDDGFEAPGFLAAYRAVAALGEVHVVAPTRECSACSHTLTLHRPITVKRHFHAPFGEIFSVDGTPADCVRLAIAELLQTPIHLVVSGVNKGANTGVDVFYSGTVAAAREAAILDIPAIAVSQALRDGFEPDWEGVSNVASKLIPALHSEGLPGPGFWNVNLPAPLPPFADRRVVRVPVELVAAPMTFKRTDIDSEKTIKFQNGAPYWSRHAKSLSDYTVVRDGAIAVSAVPLCGRF